MGEGRTKGSLYPAIVSHKSSEWKWFPRRFEGRKTPSFGPFSSPLLKLAFRTSVTAFSTLIVRRR